MVVKCTLNDGAIEHTLVIDGVDDFKRALVRKIRDKQAAGMRTGADVEHIAKAFEQMSGDVPAIGLTDSDRDQLVETLADAAALPFATGAFDLVVQSTVLGREGTRLKCRLGDDVAAAPVGRPLEAALGRRGRGAAVARVR